MSWRRVLAVIGILAMLWPVWMITDWAVRMQPGKGPQGGEAIAILALMAWLAWQALAIVQALRLRRRAAASRWQRAGVALAPLVAFILTLVWTDREWPAVPAGVLVAALLAGSQLWALWRVPAKAR